jgi:hypothetical protein
MFVSNNRALVNNPFNISQELVHDPLVVVNTFTEHHGGDWSVKDMQHTLVSHDFLWSSEDLSDSFIVASLALCVCSLFQSQRGYLFTRWTGWCGGILGLWLSRNNQVSLHDMLDSPFIVVF